MTTSTEYLSVTDTAKLLRKALKSSFPTVKFSVKSRSYSGGSSIDVYWTDGPAERVVNPVLQQFSGASFDGMIDLKIHNQAWLLPDGTAQLAYQPGTDGSIPEYVTDAPHPDAVLVRFGADFIFSNRTETNYDAQLRDAEWLIHQCCRVDGEGAGARFGNEWVSNLAHSMVRDRSEGEEWDEPFRRVVLRERD